MWGAFLHPVQMQKGSCWLSGKSQLPPGIPAKSPRSLFPAAPQLHFPAQPWRGSMASAKATSSNDHQEAAARALLSLLTWKPGFPRS